MSRSKWNRVARDRRCPICDKPDWCMVATDGTAAICARVESERRSGDAGWLHRLTGDWKPKSWRTIPKQASPVAKDVTGVHLQCRSEFRTESACWLATDLGISTRTLEAFEVGFHASKRVFSFPMRRPNGGISGIRYRTFSGKKFSERGGREGLFFVPGSFGKHLVIVEGPTDAMAIYDLGIQSVIGRSNCRGNTDQIVTLCRRLQLQSVLVIPDNDVPGVTGAVALRSSLMLVCPAQLLQLPEGIKDVRACVQRKEKADWLADQIGVVQRQISMETRNDCTR